METKPKVYIDASAIIDALKYDQFQVTPKSEGVKLESHPYFINDFKTKKLHVEYCSKLLKAARHKEIQLLTSTLSVAEVWHISKKPPPTEEEKRILESVLTSGTIIQLVPDNYFIAIRARDLAWNFEIHLTGMDAIHVASALEAGVWEFITTDKVIQDNAEKIARIEGLGLKVIRADQTAVLPESYTTPLLDETPIEE